VIVCFVNIGVNCSPSLFTGDGSFADIGGIIDHHCLEMIVCFVDIGVNC
jgi:hypothetical protein